MTYATQKAAYRARARAAGKLQPLFERGQFIAIDGEGFNGDETVTFETGEGRRYEARRHEYAYLAASDGAEIYSPSRLTAPECLNFLIERASQNKDAILVVFRGSYDVTHMLGRDLEPWQIDILLRGDNGRRVLDVTFGDWDYRLECRMNKSLSIWRWPAGTPKHEKHTKKNGETIWRRTKHERAVLWDVWGFFQDSFIGALNKWLPDDPDWNFIQRMKGERSIFDRSEMETIRKYNQAELRCLVTMMEKVRDSLRSQELPITRWDGAGAIAGAMFKKYNVKDHMAPSPSDVFDAARAAYSGGHIEACKIGYHDGKVYHYDINSAYPHQFRKLPSLYLGKWSSDASGGNPPGGFTLVKVAYRFFPGLPFYPLFYRLENGSIIYPERGCGWYWFNEFEAARDFAALHGSIEFRVIEWHHFQPTNNEPPFRWIEELFERRKALVEESKRTGKPNGEEKTLKLGYNSCYGKTAQQVGARWEDGEWKAPTYFQIEWAGYVTAGCRAQLMRAAMSKPHAIISFATDGLFSTEPLDLDTPKEKILGAWEAQVHDGMTIVMPGVYWLHDAGKVQHYSRGFDKKTMSDCEFVHRAWKQGETDIPIALERMVTMGVASMSAWFWTIRGYFAKSFRTLQLNGGNSKRWPLAMSTISPHKGLVSTHPRDIPEDYHMALDGLMSKPYPLSWLKNDEPELSRDEAADSFFMGSDETDDNAFFIQPNNSPTHFSAYQ